VRLYYMPRAYAYGLFLLFVLFVWPEALRGTMASASVIPASLVVSDARSEAHPSALPSGPADAVSVSILKHEGFVFVDRLADNNQQLTHIISHEKHVLPTGTTWIVDYDDEGFMALVSDNDSHEPILVEELLRIKVYETHDHKYVFISAAYHGYSDIVHLSVYMDRYTEIDFSFPCGSLRANTTFRCGLFKWQRVRARVYFSAKMVYENMGFTMFEKYAWRWWRDSAPSWHNLMGKLGLPGHVLMSNRVASSKL
jgi:hypothetical protein